ncbi:MAG: hypothetical protein Q4A07_09725 [Coriobacteriales bacterium]|nr:hypothetical protein [Coriobacteriales bacterium]
MEHREPVYPRESYLRKLRPFYHDTDIIKVLTGVRRCGKSCIMRGLALIGQEARLFWTSTRSKGP